MECFARDGTAAIELHIPRKTPSLMVPADAIIFNATGSQVAVVENGIVHMRKIIGGARLGHRRSKCARASSRATR